MAQHNIQVSVLTLQETDARQSQNPSNLLNQNAKWVFSIYIWLWEYLLNFSRCQTVIPSLQEPLSDICLSKKSTEDPKKEEGSQILSGIHIGWLTSYSSFLYAYIGCIQIKITVLYYTDLFFCKEMVDCMYGMLCISFCLQSN